MKTIATALAFAALIGGTAFAQTMSNAFGNTLVVTYANGTQSRYHFNQDGTFTGVAPSGSQMAGQWAVDADQLCLIPPSGRQMCAPMEADKNVGDTWEQIGVDGSPITVTLEAGR